MGKLTSHTLNGSDQMAPVNNKKPQTRPKPKKNPYNPVRQRKQYLDWNLKNKQGA